MDLTKVLGISLGNFWFGLNVFVCLCLVNFILDLFRYGKKLFKKIRGERPGNYKQYRRRRKYVVMVCGPRAICFGFES